MHPVRHHLADRVGCRLEVKDEGKHYPGFGANPTLSFKDRGMAMTVSMARMLGLTRLAVPTQGNAGDSLAEYAIAANIEAVIVLSPATDLPVIGKVAAYAQLYPANVKLELVPVRSSIAASVCVSTMFLWVISTLPHSRSQAGAPKGKRHWGSRWPNPPVIVKRIADGSSPT